MLSQEELRTFVVGLKQRRGWRVLAYAATGSLCTFGLVRGADAVQDLSGFWRTGTLWLDVLTHMTLRVPVKAPLFSAIVLGSAGLAAVQTRSLLGSCAVAFGLVFGVSLAIVDSPRYVLFHGHHRLAELVWFSGTLALLLGVGGFLLAEGIGRATGRNDL